MLFPVTAQLVIAAELPKGNFGECTGVDGETFSERTYQNLLRTRSWRAKADKEMEFWHSCNFPLQWEAKLRIPGSLYRVLQSLWTTWGYSAQGGHPLSSLCQSQ